MISVCFQGNPFNITVNQVYAPTSNAEEAEVGWVYEDLQDLPELTYPKYVIFILEDWNAKIGGQEIPGITVKFGLGVQNDEGQRLTEFCQENTVVIKHPLPKTQENSLHMGITRWSILKTDWLYYLQPNMEKLCTSIKNRSWLWFRSRTPYGKIQM